MSVDHSAPGWKSHIADALTRFRMFAALPLLVLILMGYWEWALGLVWLMIASDALDGPAARLWGHAEDRNSHGSKRTAKELHKFDNDADGAMSIALVLGVVVRVFLANLNGWDDGIYSLPWIIGLAVLACIMTPLFIWLTNEFKAGPYFDVAHGIYFGLLLAACLWVMTAFAAGSETSWNVLFWSQWTVAMVFIIAKADRIFSPRWDEAEYNGERTVKSLFYN